MNELQLITSKTFNGLHFDCYTQPEQQDKGDFWATRTQIGQLLGYVEPRIAIAKIHERNKERLDKFSTVTNLTTVEGDRAVTREVFLYSFKGLLEICRYSQQPNANAVMDWLFDVADEIRRTGSYSIRQKQQQIPNVPLGFFKAVDKIIRQALDCKEQKDFQATLALDEVFKKKYGQSALELAGFTLVKKYDYCEGRDGRCGWCYRTGSHFEWEHSLPNCLD